LSQYKAYWLIVEDLSGGAEKRLEEGSEGRSRKALEQLE
jgi:hypothetical protein